MKESIIKKIRLILVSLFALSLFHFHPVHPVKAEEEDYGTWTLEGYQDVYPDWESDNVTEELSGHTYTFTTWSDTYEYADYQGERSRSYFSYTCEFEDPPAAMAIGQEYMTQWNATYTIGYNDYLNLGNTQKTGFQFQATVEVYNSVTGERELYTKWYSDMVYMNSGSQTVTVYDPDGLLSSFPEDMNKNSILKITCDPGYSVTRVYTYKYNEPGPVHISQTQEASETPGEGNQVVFPGTIVDHDDRDVSSDRFPWVPVIGGGVVGLTVIGAIAGRKPKDDKGSTSQGSSSGQSGKKPASAENKPAPAKEKPAAAKEKPVPTKEKPVQAAPQESEQKERKLKSTFRMVIYKEFGNTIAVGDEPSEVFARIEERREDGMVRERPDLSERIKITARDNLRVRRTFFEGRYRGAEVEAYENADGTCGEKGTVTFRFESSRGSIENNVVFNLESGIEIKFCQESIAFIAEQGESSFIGFFVKGLGENPEFELRLDKGARQAFEVSDVRPAEDNCWAIDIREIGSKKQTAGSMEVYNCRVTARQPAEGDRVERKAVGDFSIVRFHEGLLMRISDLKAYLVKNGTQELTQTEDPKFVRGVKMTPAHTRLEVNLFTWDEEEKWLTNPVPDDLKIYFEDVESDEEFLATDGRGIRNPVELLDYKYNLLAITGNSNTILCELFSGKDGGFLMPPVRGKAKVTVRAMYQGREFEVSKTVNLISMPRRTSTQVDQMAAADRETEQKIMHMIETLFRDDRAYEMRPLLHRLELILNSYDQDFGYYMDEVYDCMRLYLKWVHGIIGSKRNAENLTVYEYFWGPTAEQTLMGWKKSEAGFVERITMAIITTKISMMTTGVPMPWSEVVWYMPRSLTVEYLMRLQEASDKASDNALKNFTVGLNEAGWMALREYAYHLGGEFIVAPTLKFGTLVLKENAKELAKSATKMGVRLKAGYSSALWKYRADKAASILSGMEKKAKENALKRLANGREYMAGNQRLLMDSKTYKEYMEESIKLVKEFEAAIKNPNISDRELTILANKLQQCKGTYNYMNSGAVSRNTIRRFNIEMQVINERTLRQTRQEIADTLNTHVDNIRQFNATTNDPKALFSGNKRAADLDFTFTDARTGEDISSQVTNKIFGKHYYKNVYGTDAPSEAAAENLRIKSDMTGVARGDLDSYDSNIVKMMNPEMDHLPYDDIQNVMETSIHKTEQWLTREADSAGEEIMNRWEGSRSYMKTNARTNYRNAKAIIEEGRLSELPLDDLQQLMDDDAMFKETMKWKNGGMTNYAEYEAALESEGKDLMSGIRHSAEVMEKLQNLQSRTDMDIFNDLYNGTNDAIEGFGEFASTQESSLQHAVQGSLPRGDDYKMTFDDAFFQNADSNISEEKVAEYLSPERRINLTEAEIVYIKGQDTGLSQEKIESAVENDKLIDEYFTYSNADDVGDMLEFLAALSDKGQTLEDAEKENREVADYLDQQLGLED